MTTVSSEIGVETKRVIGLRIHRLGEKKDRQLVVNWLEVIEANMTECFF